MIFNMRLLATSLLFLTTLSSCIFAADSNGKSKPTKPCTLHSPTSGSYFDLTRLEIFPPDDPKKSISSAPSQHTESWHARGYDYGANFTLNFCGPVIEDLEDVEGVDKKYWRNVSAYYTTEKGKTFSIGQANSEPLFRGRKLVLNYTDGSPCPDFEDVESSPKAEHRKRKSKHDDDEKEDDDDDDDDRKPSKKKSSKRRKSTIMSFLCDTSPSVTSHPQISFIGTLDSCSYHFEVRSRYACGGASSSDQSSLGPGGVFAVILAIAIVAYLIGGCAYQRTVMHQRGWRQCPNYGVWVGIFSFLGVSGLFRPKARGESEWGLPTDRFD